MTNWLKGNRASAAWWVAIAIAGFAGEAPAQTAPEAGYLPIHGSYLKAVKAALLKDWHPLHSYPFDALCPIQVRQTEEGGILSISFSDRCMLDAAERERLKSAIQVGGNLPVEGFEHWFRHGFVVDLRSWDVGVDTGFSVQESRSTLDQKSLQRMKPRFPEGLARFVGTTTIVVAIDDEGDVERIYVETSSGSAEMDDQAIYLASHWTFFPQVKGGRRVAYKMRMPVDFEFPPKPGAARGVYTSYGKKTGAVRGRGGDNEGAEASDPPGKKGS